MFALFLSFLFPAAILLGRSFRVSSVWELPFMDHARVHADDDPRKRDHSHAHPIHALLAGTHARRAPADQQLAND